MARQYLAIAARINALRTLWELYTWPRSIGRFYELEEYQQGETQPFTEWALGTSTPAQRAALYMAAAHNDDWQTDDAGVPTSALAWAVYRALRGADTHGSADGGMWQTWAETEPVYVLADIVPSLPTDPLPAPLHASITSAWSHTFGDALGGARAHDEHRIVMRSRVLLRIGGRRLRGDGHVEDAYENTVLGQSALVA
jgi:hypothetical protein